MARIKIFLDVARTDEQSVREPQGFLDHLDAALRKSSGGMEWAVQGASHTVRDVETGQVHLRRVYLCEVEDVDERWPLIEELIRNYDLEKRTTAYREEGLHTGWDQLWPSANVSG